MGKSGQKITLMPVAALLFASLMIASLVGIQGAIDRALNVTLAGGPASVLGQGASTMAPILTPRQPAEAAASEVLEREASNPSITISLAVAPLSISAPVAIPPTVPLASFEDEPSGESITKPIALLKAKLTSRFFGEKASKRAQSRDSVKGDSIFTYSQGNDSDYEQDSRKDRDVKPARGKKK